MKPKINLIWAQTQDGYIGKGGTMPWHLPEDLERFKWLTTGCPVIMGRKTWDSIPAKFRPLPGRRNIVLSHSASHHPFDVCQKHDDGSFRAAWKSDAMAVAAEFCRTNKCDDIWIIGGKQIYDFFLPDADYVYRTTLHATYPDCDTKAPVLDPMVWKPSWTKMEQSSTGIVYENTILKRTI